jgi:hypothetical protein
MGSLVLGIFLLVLLLTGAIVPVLIFGGWALVVVLGVVLALWIVAKAFGLVFKPLVVLGNDVGQAFGWWGPPRHPSPGDPVYLNWANREGEYRIKKGPKDVNELAVELQKRRGKDVRFGKERSAWEQEQRKRWEQEEERWRRHRDGD